MLILAHDGEHSAIEMDVSNSHSVSSGFIRLKELQSRPADIIVNCAGITSDGFLLNMTETMFDEVIKINLKVTYTLVVTTVFAERTYLWLKIFPNNYLTLIVVS